MTSEEHVAIIQQIAANLSDQATVTTLLNNLQTDYTEVLTTTTTTTTENARLVSDNEKLRNANMNLFLQVGSVPKPEVVTPTPGTPPIVEETEPKELFEKLFDDKGRLL